MAQGNSEVAEQIHESCDECAICMDAVEHVMGLPCSCRVSYCLQCWDQALAASFNSCGHARCPTCRTPIQVDFDVKTGSLVFSRYCPEDSDLSREAQVDGESDEGTQQINRIQKQARPAQIQRLQSHGAKFPCGDSSLTSLAPAACVCGGSLEKLTGPERYTRMCKRLFPHTPQASSQFAHVIERVTAYALEHPECQISCDICSGGVPPSDDYVVWSCENGRATIFHPGAHDICATCFDEYTDGTKEATGVSQK